MHPTLHTLARCLTLGVLAGALACAGDAADDVVIPATTKVLDDAAQASLVSYASGDGTLVATLPSALAALVPGDVVVCGVVAGVAPQGFLRKVTGATRADGRVTVTTAPAGLVDAIDTGTLTAAVDPGAEMVDMTRSTGDPTVTIGPAGRRTIGDRTHIPSGSGIHAHFANTELGGLTINGDIAFDLHIDAAMRIEYFRLTHFRFIVTIDMDTDLTLDGSVDLPVPGVGGEVPLWTIYFTPIAFAIGPVPIVITPRLALAYGADISAQITVAGLHLQNSTTAQVGTDYTPATGWVDHSFGSGTGATAIDALPQIGLTFDTYARAELAFMLYDVIGPYVWTNQGLIFDLHTQRDPFFRAGVHVRGGLGGRIDIAPGSILNLVDFAPTLLDVIGWFFASPNTPPFVTVSNPLDGDYTTAGRFTALAAGAFDLEDGPLGDAIHWTSDRDGDLGVGASRPAVALWRTGPGVHTITASVTDSDLVTTSQVARVTVLNEPPTVVVASPRGGDVAYLDTAVGLSGAVTSPFVASGDACSASGWTFRWTSSNVGDLITSGTSCAAVVRLQGAAGPRTLTLRADDPWPAPLSLSGARSVIVNAQPRPPNVFASVDLTSPLGAVYDGDMDGVLPTPLVLTATVAGPPTPVGAITYTWSARAADAPGPWLAVGTGNNLAWQPASTAGLLDATLNTERIELRVEVTDTAGNNGTMARTFEIRFAPG